MKKIFTLIVFCHFMSAAIAQYGTAHDFTVTDINGNVYNLYEILDDGKVVVLDVSTTWCGTCWNVHQNHYLEDLNKEFGPEGTNEIVVIFYEGDAGTDDNALNGISGNTLGDWVSGTSYPIINESPLTLNLSVYAPLGFPTIYLIRPSDREIVVDMWDFNLASMRSAVQNLIDAEGLSSNEQLFESNLTIAPNPVSQWLNIDNDYLSIQEISVVNLVGQNLMTLTDQDSQVDVSALNPGQYFVRIISDKGTVNTAPFIKL